MANYIIRQIWGGTESQRVLFQSAQLYYFVNKRTQIAFLGLQICQHCFCRQSLCGNLQRSTDLLAGFNVRFAQRREGRGRKKGSEWKDGEFVPPFLILLDPLVYMDWLYWKFSQLVDSVCCGWIVE